MACLSAPQPCPDLAIHLCAPASGAGSNVSSGGDCMDPAAPFDSTTVRCFLDAYIAGTPAQLSVSYSDNTASPDTQDKTEKYVLFGDGTVSIKEVQVLGGDPFYGCSVSSGTVKSSSYLNDCKASATDADLLDCFRGAIQPATQGAHCPVGTCTP